MLNTSGSSGIGREAVRPRSDAATKLLGSLLFAVFMAVTSLSFRLWFTPVPVTLQVFGVILSGLVLGSRWGAVSQVQYLVMGLSGLPVFSHGQGGPAVLMGPTGGYLIGFVLGAYLSGLIYERLGRRGVVSSLAAGIIGVVGIYTPGAAWLGTWMAVAGGKSFAACLQAAWQLGVVPFAAVDLLKAVLASGLVNGWAIFGRRSVRHM